jgi:transposase
MMGSQGAGQAPLFYAFNLEDHIPGDHLLRGIDRFVDLSELRQHLAAFYSHTGRPSIDPELMIRMLVIGYCFGIRSERRLCEEVHLNLAYRWFCRLGLEDRIPDHSTFSKNRHGRFRQGDAFRHVFESVLRRCMGEGLVGGEGFAIDASVIKADANRAKGVPGNQPPTGTKAKGPAALCANISVRWTRATPPLMMTSPRIRPAGRQARPRTSRSPTPLLAGPRRLVARRSMPTRPIT